MAATGHGSKAWRRHRDLPLGLATILGIVMPAPGVIFAADPPASFVSDTSGKAGADGADNNETCLTCNPNGHPAAAGGNGTAQSLALDADADVRGGGSSPSVYIAANGGTGGNGGNAGTSTLSFGNGGNGGNAGSAGNLTVTFGGTHRIDSSSTAEAAVLVSGVGGHGGDGGNPANRGHGGHPGFGSTGSPQATVVQAVGASLISTTAGVAGLLVRLDGGHGGATQGDTTTGSDKANGIDGGNAGSGGSLQGAWLSGTITSAGSGVVVTSIGGNGGDGGAANTTGLAGATGGNGGGGGFGGAIDLTLAGTLAARGADKHATGAGIDVDSRDGKSLVKATSSVVTGGLIAISEGGLGGDGGTADGGFGPAKGGSGGNAGNGGKIVLATSGPTLSTSGYGAAGIVGQSIGGSGGNGANAGAVFHSRGGSGQSGGAGDAVVLNLADGSLATTGDDSDAIHAQSIGGGGGYGGDVSVGGIGAAITIGGQGANGGAGGNVQLWNGFVGYDPNGNPVDERGSQIVTSGEMSRGVVAQSVGGGGGNGGFSVAAGSGGTINANVAVGGNGGAGGRGGAVTVDNGAGAITTSGGDSTAIYAQSIGGGGGAGGATVASSGTLSAFNIAMGGDGGSNGDGGRVQVQQNGQVETSGRDAAGILAQSIGGGGGLIGGMSGVDIGCGARASAAAQTGQGGDVTVTVAEGGIVSAQGRRAHGIFAQSLGGGGAVVSQADDNGYVMASASPYAGCSGQACTGRIAVAVAGQVAVSGADSYAVAVQSHGNGVNDTSLSVSADGRVVVIEEAAAAVFVDGAGTNTIDNAGLISGSGASGGIAIAGVTPATVANSGTIDGSVELPGRSTLANRQAGTFAAGPTLRLARLDNAGTVEVAGAGRIGTTRLSGDLVQSETGRLAVDTDHVGGRADRLEVDGDARIAGTVSVRPMTLGHDPVTVLTAGGSLRMEPQLTFAGSHLFSYRPTVIDSGLRITPEADFRSGSDSLSGTRRSVAAHLQQIWDSAADGFGEAFAALATLDDADGYGSTLDAMSGQAVSAVGTARLAASRGFVDNMDGCEAFVGDGTLLTQTDCSWGRVFGTLASRDADDRTVGFDSKAVTTQLGGQKQIGDGWFLGGSLGYELSRLDGDHDSADVDGEALLAGLMLKRQIGRLLLSGAVDGGYGWYDSARTIDLGDSRERAKGSPKAANLGLHARIAYQLPFASWYVQPYLDLSATYVRMDSYEESGAGAFDLDVDDSDKLVLSAIPSVELGRRLALPDGSILRAYASGGIALYGPNNFATDARLADAPGSAGSFRSELRNPNVAARLGLGVEVMTTRSIDLKLQYDADLASDSMANSATARLSWRF